MKLQRKYKQEIVKPKGSNNHNTDKPDISLDKPKQENTMLTILFSVNICNTSQVKNLKTLMIIDLSPFFTLTHALFQRTLMIFNSFSNQQVLILMSLLFQNKGSSKYTISG